METVARPQVFMAGREAEVLFSGAAPGFPGLYQVNARVPAGVAAGTQPLTMRVDGAASNEVRVVVGPGTSGTSARRRTRSRYLIPPVET